MISVCCLFFEKGFKTEELCDEHMCAGKLKCRKKLKIRIKIDLFNLAVKMKQRLRRTLNLTQSCLQTKMLSLLKGN